MSYIFFLDGTLYDNPAEDRSLSTSIKRNSNLNGLLITQDSKLRFQGEAYTYLYDKFFVSLCDEVEIEIWETCGNDGFLIYEGTIKMSDIEINQQECELTTDLMDKNFFAYINNNKSIDVSLTDSFSKNGEVITFLEPYDVDFFDPSTGVYGPTPVKMFRLFDVFEWVLQYITDGRVTFASDLISGSNPAIDEELPQLFLTQGDAIRFPGQMPDPIIEISFDDLYKNVRKLKNTSFRMEDQVFRLEEEDYFFTALADFSFVDIKDLKISIDTKSLYANVKLGSSETDNGSYLNCFDEDVDYFGFKQEKFHLLGQCNLDNELDLEVDWIISHNVIEDLFMWLRPDNWTDIVVVECEEVDTVNLTAQAKQYTLDGAVYPYSGGCYLYNMGLTNNNTLLNHSSSFHNTVLSYLASREDQFKAKLTADIPFNTTGGGALIIPPTNPLSANWPTLSTASNPNPFEYDDVTSLGNYNIGNNYSTGTFLYTVPADGDYSFEHQAKYTVVNLKTRLLAGVPLDDQMVIWVLLRQYRGGVKIQEAYVRSSYQYDQIDIVSCTQIFSCLTGDTIRAVISRACITWNTGTQLPYFILDNKSFFSCTQTPTSGGFIAGNDTDAFKAYLYKFNYPVPQNDFLTIKSDPTKLFTFSANGIERKGWIYDMKYNHWENEAQVTLFASNAVNQNT